MLLDEFKEFTHLIRLGVFGGGLDREWTTQLGMSVLAMAAIGADMLEAEGAQ